MNDDSGAIALLMTPPRFLAPEAPNGADSYYPPTVYTPLAGEPLAWDIRTDPILIMDVKRIDVLPSYDAKTEERTGLSIMVRGLVPSHAAVHNVVSGHDRHGPPYAPPPSCVWTEGSIYLRAVQMGSALRYAAEKLLSRAIGVPAGRALANCNDLLKLPIGRELASAVASGDELIDVDEAAVLDALSNILSESAAGLPHVFVLTGARASRLDSKRTVLDIRIHALDRAMRMILGPPDNPREVTVGEMMERPVAAWMLACYTAHALGFVPTPVYDD